jgi:hypothetical protein
METKDNYIFIHLPDSADFMQDKSSRSFGKKQIVK